MRELKTEEIKAVSGGINDPWNEERVLDTVTVTTSQSGYHSLPGMSYWDPFGPSESEMTQGEGGASFTPTQDSNPDDPWQYYNDPTPHDGYLGLNVVYNDDDGTLSVTTEVDGFFDLDEVEGLSGSEEVIPAGTPATIDIDNADEVSALSTFTPYIGGIS